MSYDDRCNGDDDVYDPDSLDYDYPDDNDYHDDSGGIDDDSDDED